MNTKEAAALEGAIEELRAALRAGDIDVQVSKDDTTDHEAVTFFARPGNTERPYVEWSLTRERKLPREDGQ